MSIQYAIEINSETSVTDASFGCQSGVFRFITGSPGYDGNPTYPLWEDWSPNTNIWYEGFITKDGLSNPSRQVDISKSGDYGVLSGFDFTIRNTEKFWNFIKSNDIYLVNKTIKLYTVISDTFFQVWQGVISNNPYDEVNFKFQCNDNFRKIHKYLPPEVINKTNYEDAADSDLSKTIPVSLGDIPYAKLMKIENIENNFINLNIKDGNNYDTAAAYSYYTSGSGIYKNNITILTHGITFTTNELEGNFLIATCGDGAVTDKIIRILGNNASTTIAGFYITQIALAEPLQETTESSFNNLTNHLKYDTLNQSDLGHLRATEDTWWFKIFSIDVTTSVSNSTIYSFQKLNSQIQLYSWDSDLKKFVDIKELISYNESTGAISILANNVNEDGEVIVTSRIPSTIKKAYYEIKRTTTGGFQNGTSIHAIPDSYLEIFSDGSRTSGYYEIKDLTNGNTQPKKVVVKFILDPNQISSIKNYDDIYMGVDLTITTPNYFSTWIQVFCRDVYGYPLSDPISYENYHIYPVNAAIVPPVIPTTFNFLSNEYYRGTASIASDSGSLFGEMQNLYPVGGGVATLTKVSDRLKLPSALVDAIKSKTISEISVRFYLSTSYDITNLNIKVKEFGFIGSRKVATIKGDIYTKIKGETTHSEETNHVYNAFRHILEDYDGLTDSQLDYGNIATTRNTWHLGRQIIDRQSSFEYLQELCKNSFVCLFPSRVGKRKLVAWRENTSNPSTHSQAYIVRDSIRNWTKTKIQDLYNEFFIKYNYNPAIDDFERAMFIAKVDESSFPLATDETWKKYFGGLENDSYQDAKTLWEICHSSYIRANVLSGRIPEDLANLFYYIDVNTFSSEAAYNIYKGTKSSAYLYLKNLVEWASRQKDDVTYNLPINSVNIKSELLDPIIFNDPIYTNSVDRTGWMTKIEIDTKKDQIVVTTTIEPYDIISVDDDLIIETGNADTLIIESGSEAETIVET